MVDKEGNPIDFYEVVAEKDGYKLLETSKLYCGNPCMQKMLETIFPDFNYCDDKVYYMEKNGKLIDGDSMLED